jgi:Asp/Glu/hydantoin racemase
MLAEHAGAADAVVIAAYGDPALTAAREMLDIPVVGMAEAAMLTACMLGQRFGVVTFSAALVPWYAEGVALSGLGPRCAGIRTPAAGFASVATVRDELRSALADACGRMAREDGADVAILAGAPLAGLATALADEAPIVLLDPVSAAVRQAETLARLAPRGANRGSFARPAPKPTIGLPEALARRIEGR